MCAKAIPSAPAPLTTDQSAPLRDKCIEDGTATATFLDNIYLWALLIPKGSLELHNYHILKIFS